MGNDKLRRPSRTATRWWQSMSPTRAAFLSIASAVVLLLVLAALILPGVFDTGPDWVRPTPVETLPEAPFSQPSPTST